jgi:hypothetical protein
MIAVGLARLMVIKESRDVGKSELFGTMLIISSKKSKKWLLNARIIVVLLELIFSYIYLTTFFYMFFISNNKNEYTIPIVILSYIFCKYMLR